MIKKQMCFNVIHTPSMQECSPKHILNWFWNKQGPNLGFWLRLRRTRNLQRNQGDITTVQRQKNFWRFMWDITHQVERTA